MRTHKVRRGGTYFTTTDYQIRPGLRDYSRKVVPFGTHCLRVVMEVTNEKVQISAGKWLV